MAEVTKGSAQLPSGAGAGDLPSGKQSWETSHSSSDNNQSDQYTDDQLDMPPGGQRRPHTPKREADLSGFLTSNEKQELCQLVSRITDGMQRQIYRTFDSSGVDKSPEESSSFWGKLPASLRDLSLNAGPKKVATPGKENPALSAEQRAQETIQKEEKEAMGTGLQELKKELLQSFRRWQTAVNRRVGDISVKNPSASQKGQGPGSAWKKGSKSGGVQPSVPEDTNMTIREADEALVHLYPPTSTALVSLPWEKRTLLLHAMLLLVLSLEQYSAFSRILLLNLSSSLHVPLHVLAEDEVRVAKSLGQVTKDLTGDEVAQKRSEENRSSRSAG